MTYFSIIQKSISMLTKLKNWSSLQMLLSIYLRYFEDISRWDLNKDTYGYKNCWLVSKLLELAVLKVDDCKDNMEFRQFLMIKLVEYQEIKLRSWKQTHMKLPLDTCEGVYLLRKLNSSRLQFHGCATVWRNIFIIVRHTIRLCLISLVISVISTNSQARKYDSAD